jgi:ABC-type tungstate transport system permease subunit
MKTDACLSVYQIHDFSIVGVYNQPSRAKEKKDLTEHLKKCNVCRERLHAHKLDLVRANEASGMDKKERKLYEKYLAEMASLDEYDIALLEGR